MKKITILTITAALFFNIAAAWPREYSGDRLMKEANILFLKGDYRSLVSVAEKNIPGSRLSRKNKKELLYLAGISYIKLGDHRRARGFFNEILEMKGEDFREEAYVGIGDAYFNEKNYKNAVKAYEDAITRYPRSDRLSGIYHNMGLSYKAENDFERANWYFNKVERNFKSSFEAGADVYVPSWEGLSCYIVQIGAFESLKNAKKLVRDLTRKKYDSYILKTKRDGEILYKVRGGKFSNKNYAERLARKLKRDGFHAKIIEE